jgi:hypothetical protein
MCRLKSGCVNRLILGITIITFLVFLATKLLIDSIESEPAVRASRFFVVPITALLTLFILRIVLHATEILP